MCKLFCKFYSICKYTHLYCSFLCTNVLLCINKDFEIKPITLKAVRGSALHLAVLHMKWIILSRRRRSRYYREKTQRTRWLSAVFNWFFLSTEQHAVCPSLLKTKDLSNKPFFCIRTCMHAFVNKMHWQQMNLWMIEWMDVSIDGWMIAWMFKWMLGWHIKCFTWNN